MSEATIDDRGRGRAARGPTDIPAKGWKDVLMRVWNEMGRDHVTVVAAGVAFFGLLAIFPAIAAIVSIAALVMDPAEIQRQLSEAAATLPEGAASILQGQADKVASGAGGAVGLAAIFGILLAIWSSKKGMDKLIEGMNIAYDEEEKRGFIALTLLSLALTAFLIVGVVIAAGFTIVAPAVLAALPLGSALEGWVTYARWPVLLVVTVLGLSVVYRYGPSRENPRWRWVSWGALAAAILWIVGSVAFSIYVRNFGSYNETYGALGGVIVLLLWLWLSAWIVLMGAELNSETEHQTEHDSTTGPERPMGERGAVKADTLGETR